MRAVDFVGCKALMLSDFRPGGPHHRVGPGQQLVDQFDVVVKRRIRDDAVLGTREKAEQRAVLDVRAGLDDGTRSRPAPQRIAFWRLDFDNAGTAVRKQLGAVSARDPGRQVHHREAGQRWFDRGLRH